MKRACCALLLALGAAGSACDGGENAHSGLDEPIRIRNATFRYGALPGSPSPAALDGGAEGSDGGAPLPLGVVSVDSLNNVVTPGEAGKKLSGHAAGAVAIGVRFPELGSGYWAFPVDVPDPQQPPQVVWEAVADFGKNLSPGLHPLRFVAFDAQGVAGGQRDLKLCIASPTSGIHPCSPKAATSEAVIELTWDRTVDLDLVVTTPDGRTLSSKRPSTAKADGDGGVSFHPETDGVLAFDSNGACVIDGANREEMSWAAYPSKGTYQVRVNLFDACSQASVRFNVVIYAASGEGVNRDLEVKFRASGELLDIDANPSSPGMFVTDFIF